MTVTYYSGKVLVSAMVGSVMHNESRHWGDLMHEIARSYNLHDSTISKLAT